MFFTSTYVPFEGVLYAPQNFFAYTYICIGYVQFSETTSTTIN
jgi:hypothetical protein